MTCSLQNYHLLEKHLWLSNRPLLPPLLQQEALFLQRASLYQHQSKHQIFKQFFQALPHQVKQEDE
jgi:hypothetical protein